MKYVSLILSEDAARECVHSLGLLGAIQFTDLNPEQTPFQRRYVGFIKRCDELERKLRFIDAEIVAFGLRHESQPIDNYSMGAKVGSRSSTALLDTLEVDLERYEEQLLEFKSFSTQLTTKYNEKVEYRECLDKSKSFFETAVLLQNEDVSNPIFVATGSSSSEDGLQPLLGDEAASGGGELQRSLDSDMKFSSTVGVLNLDDKVRFERMLFRSTRGNCLARFAEVNQPMTDAVSGKAENKIIFIVFFKSEVIGVIINKICDAFGARQYPVPDHTALGDASRLNLIIRDQNTELADAREVLLKNRELRLALCSRLVQHLSRWKLTVLHEKAVYHTLNLFRADVSGMLRAEGWIIASAEAEARALITRSHAAMDLAGASMLAVVPLPWPAPPTSFKINEFTRAFQEFVDTYGVPRYKEINPALFTAATFPFLFGMMYGDIGHGTCILLAGLYLAVTHSDGCKSGDEMVSGIYGARYMLIMMGASAVYVGFVYNDCFSLALYLFDSGYRWEGAEDGVSGTVMGGMPANMTAPYGTASGVYPFGVDPTWHVSENELLFFNSMKMKTAVIFGVAQMTLGIVLKGINALYFREHVVFCLEFLPMLIFDFCLFVYMVILIFTKWAIDWEKRQLMGTCVQGQTYDDTPCTSATPLKEKCALKYGGDSGGCAPPNLINQLINIALNPGTVEEPMYNGQGSTQSGLLAVAFLCVPTLLCGKPVYNYFQHEAGSVPSPEEHSVSEELIHQCIETIEFVLGMISNTASYLRLWALSLAHSELAQVFWEKVMVSALRANDGFLIFASYSIFAVITLAVLLAMDLLECFLHALRLHWVEFQNKFYKADGTCFTPFTVDM